MPGQSLLYSNDRSGVSHCAREALHVVESLGRRFLRRTWPSITVEQQS
jgi:hypothetical protein